MFSLFSAFATAVGVVREGYTKLKRTFQAVLRRLPGQGRAECPPFQQDLVNGERDGVRKCFHAFDALAVPDAHGSSVIISSRDAAAYPLFPLAKPPLHDCEPGGSKKGTRSAKALFHEPFKPLSPMGVFGIISNAFSPPLATSAGKERSIIPRIHEPNNARIEHTSSSNESYSPASNSAGDSPIFDVLNSPTDVSTAPTTPASDLLQLGSCEVPVELALASQNEPESSNEDVPLSALMIQGLARNAAKRNGISGDLLAKRKDVPLWVPEAVQVVSDSSFCDGDDAEILDITAEKARAGASGDDTRIGSPLPTTPKSVTNEESVQHTPLAEGKPTYPISWCDRWRRCDASPSTDEGSVYSLESYAPSIGVRRQSRRSPSAHSVPHITLTPPSASESPELRTSIVALSEQEGGIGVGADDVGQLCHSNTSLRQQNENIFSANTLLVPLSAPFMEYSYTGEEDDDDEDEALVKRQRRLACRINTSSIDIIMAGLDQAFPDSPIQPEVLDMANLEMASLTEETVDLLSPSTVTRPPFHGYTPSSPTTTLRNSVADLSGDTLLEDLESKFSDSSDVSGCIIIFPCFTWIYLVDQEEDGDFYKVPKSMFLQQNVRRSWPATSVPFNPNSVLSTIVEEEEEGTRDAARGADVPSLEPSVVIISGSRAGQPPAEGTKKRWFSMIDGQSEVAGALRTTHFKHMSAPPSLHPHANARRSHRSRLSVDYSTANGTRTATTTMGSRRKAHVRPLILPHRVAMRDLAADNTAHDQDQSLSFCGVSSSTSFSGSEYSLPSSRSSSCIALYQRPWSLYSAQEDASRAEPETHLSPGDYAHRARDSDLSAAPSTAHSYFSADDGLRDDRAEPVDLGCDVPLFVETPSFEAQGLDGILAVLNNAEYPTTSTSVYKHRNSSEGSMSSKSCQWVVDPQPTGIDHDIQVDDEGQECDVGTARPWSSNSEFVGYYGGPEASVEGWPGVAV